MAENRIYSHQDFSGFKEKGLLFLTRGAYRRASDFLRLARDASSQLFDESSLERALACYAYGLSLLCQVPVPADDPMGLVPKEIDYFQSPVPLRPYRSSIFNTYTGAMEDEYVRMLEGSKRELNLAWSLVEYKLACYEEKANILSALGEVSFRRGESNPQRYYFEASSILETLYGEDEMRVADINFKLCICLEGSDKSKAHECGRKARSAYQKRMGHLPSVIKGPFHPSLINTENPAIFQLRLQARRLNVIIGLLTEKINLLVASQRREGTSVTPEGRRDGEGEGEVQIDLTLKL